jgi:porin
MDSPDSSAPSLRQGPFTLVEVKIEPVPSGHSHSGIFRLGAWRQTRGAGLPLGTGTLASQPALNYGVYGTADYWFRKSADNKSSGAGIFLQLGWAPKDRNEISSYWGAGFSYREPIPGRSEDVIGLGITRAGCPNSAHETAVELFYKWQATAHLMIQPDLQWILHPGSAGPHALLLGLRLEHLF